MSAPRRHFARYHTAYIRGGLYAICAFLTAFISEFDAMTPERIAALTTFGWVLCWAKVLLPTAFTMRAFFDGTMERIAQTPPPPTPPTP